MILTACGASEPASSAGGAPSAGPSPKRREVCPEPPRACQGFVDTNPEDPALGASVGASAADALFCSGIIKGHAQQCPHNRDSRTQEYLCPELTRGLEFPGQQVMCGPCRSSRAEMLAFGIKALVDANTLDDLTKCAGSGRCEAWRRCEESTTGRMSASDWTADFFGWALAPGRELLSTEPRAARGESVECRPHDAAAWDETVAFFAELSGLTGHLRCSTLDVSREAKALALELKRGCRLRSVENGDQEWIAAAVALNNAGIYCMADLPGGRRTANICGMGEISTCSPTRYVMATIVARLRGDIEPAACEPIDVNDLECKS